MIDTLNEILAASLWDIPVATDSTLTVTEQGIVAETYIPHQPLVEHPGPSGRADFSDSPPARVSVESAFAGRPSFSDANYENVTSYPGRE